MMPLGVLASARVAATSGPLDPATLDTAVLLLRAKDLGAGGSNVTTWVDQSPRSNNATAPSTPPVVAAASTPSGGKSVAFTGQTLNLTKVLTGIASAAASSNPAGASFDASKAIDGNLTGNACLLSDSTPGSPQWLRLTLPAARVVTSYKMWGHSSSTSYNPTDWKFQGSNDPTFTTWTDLDTRTGVTWASTSDVKNYSFSNSTAYLYHRFWITGNVSASDYTAICEVQLSEPEEAELWVVVKANSATGNTNSWQFGNSSQVTIYPWSTGQVIDNFATTTHSDLWTPTVAVTSWRLYRVKYHSGRMDIWMDGTLQKTKTGLTWGWRPNPQVSAGFGGNIAEMFVSTGRELTSAETNGLISYFNAEHGLAVPTDGTMVADTFNRADTTTGLGVTSDGKQTWAYAGGGGASAFRILSNALVGIPAGFSRSTAVVPTGAVADYIVRATQKVAGASHGGVILRMTDNNNFYCLWAGGGVYEVWRRYAGSNWDRMSAVGTVVPAVGDTIEVTVTGTTSLIAKVNGITIFNMTNPGQLQATGSAGFMQEYTSAIPIGYDDFSLTPA